jgi:membrane peptidoglycan carboxypeptidase
MKTRLLNTLSEASGYAGKKAFQSIRVVRRKSSKWLRWIVIAALVAAASTYEMRTSALQSRILSGYAKRMSYKVEPGPSDSIVFPKHGPFDIRAGYALIPEFARRLGARGFEISEQARFSHELRRVMRWGILPPFPEPTSTKLAIHGMDGEPLFQAPVFGDYFSSFEDIPSLTVKSLLVIENRELEEPPDYRTNPVVDWERLAKAAILYAGNKLGLPVPVEGGSSLATQMVKYRHSYEGRTDSMLTKLRQMTDASLRVYQNGPDTREQRRQIVLDYLNSIPLAAAPGYGELYGLGNGLNAWFGLNLQDVQRNLSLPDGNPEKARAFKHVLALLCSVRAPSYYLMQNRSALQSRADFYVRLLARIQLIEPAFAKQVEAVPISFSVRPPEDHVASYAERKAVNEIRLNLVRLLGLPSLYELDRLHLDVESTIDPALQHTVLSLFEKLHDPAFINSAGLRGQRLLDKGDPAKVTYAMMLFEKAPQGNLLRVATDNLNAPFDINTGMKMQLGSTAKLRVLTNYLDITASLYHRFSAMDAMELQQQATDAGDPLTLWAAEILNVRKALKLDEFLNLALDRKYSASPGEAFFTGGGVHYFENFSKTDNGRILTVREATINSVNLVYIRLMRDLVRYYEARLPYNTAAVLEDINNPIRRKLLRESAEEESRLFLWQAYKDYKECPPEEIVSKLLGKRGTSERPLATLFYAWHRGADRPALTRWIDKYLGTATPEQIQLLAKAYGNPRLNLSDYGYLLGIHPLRVWCAELARDPSLTWEHIWKDSVEARRSAEAWLFKTRNRESQDLRLRVRFERDAFKLMAAEWKRFGFPFDKLVPSLATALGSSGDRPEALAQLMGILLNHGVLIPPTRIHQLRFAGDTPYETAMKASELKTRRVLPETVARAILPILAKVVETGTAVRLSGAYKTGGRPLIVGGKTGSGDNRFDTTGAGGQVVSSRPVDRTAVFVFYIGDRYYGVLTALVRGKESGEYGFTSSLPVAILKLLAPDIERVWPGSPKAAPKDLALASASSAGTAVNSQNAGAASKTGL